MTEQLKSFEQLADTDWFRWIVVGFTGWIALLMMLLSVWAWGYWCWKAPSAPSSGDEAAIRAYAQLATAFNESVSGIMTLVAGNVLLPLFNAMIVSVLAFVFTPSLADLVRGLGNRLAK